MLNFIMASLFSFPLMQINDTPGGMTVHEGLLSQYAVGVMPPTVEARQGWEQLPAVIPNNIDGFVAAWDCEKIGDMALLSINGSDWLIVMIADCSGHQSTTRWMRENNILFEISGELADEYDVVCRCAVPGAVIWLN